MNRNMADEDRYKEFERYIRATGSGRIKKMTL